MPPTNEKQVSRGPLGSLSCIAWEVQLMRCAHRVDIFLIWGEDLLLSMRLYVSE